jgi:hypothetical protein
MSYDYKKYIPSDLPLLMEYDAQDDDLDTMLDTWEMLLELLGENLIELLAKSKDQELYVDGYNLCWRGTHATMTVKFNDDIEQDATETAKHLLRNVLKNPGQNSISLYADIDRKVPKVILVVFTHDCNQVMIIS